MTQTLPKPSYDCADYIKEADWAIRYLEALAIQLYHKVEQEQYSRKEAIKDLVNHKYAMVKKDLNIRSLLESTPEDYTMDFANSVAWRRSKDLTATSGLNRMKVC